MTVSHLTVGDAFAAAMGDRRGSTLVDLRHVRAEALIDPQAALADLHRVTGEHHQVLVDALCELLLAEAAQLVASAVNHLVVGSLVHDDPLTDVDALAVPLAEMTGLPDVLSSRPAMNLATARGWARLCVRGRAVTLLMQTYWPQRVTLSRAILRETQKPPLQALYNLASRLGATQPAQDKPAPSPEQLERLKKGIEAANATRPEFKAEWADRLKYSELQLMLVRALDRAIDIIDEPAPEEAAPPANPSSNRPFTPASHRQLVREFPTADPELAADLIAALKRVGPPR